MKKNWEEKWKNWQKSSRFFNGQIYPHVLLFLQVAHRSHCFCSPRGACGKFDFRASYASEERKKKLSDRSRTRGKGCEAPSCDIATFLATARALRANSEKKERKKRIRESSHTKTQPCINIDHVREHGISVCSPDLTFNALSSTAIVAMMYLPRRILISRTSAIR